MHKLFFFPFSPPLIFSFNLIEVWLRACHSLRFVKINTDERQIQLDYGRFILGKKVKSDSVAMKERQIGHSLHPSSSLWSPQSLSPSHCHWAGIQVHSPNALTAHVKWFLPHEHSALPRTPANVQTWVVRATVGTGTVLRFCAACFDLGAACCSSFYHGAPPAEVHG